MRASEEASEVSSFWELVGMASIYWPITWYISNLLARIIPASSKRGTRKPRKIRKGMVFLFCLGLAKPRTQYWIVYSKLLNTQRWFHVCRVQVEMTQQGKKYKQAALRFTWLKYSSQVHSISPHTSKECFPSAPQFKGKQATLLFALSIGMVALASLYLKQILQWRNKLQHRTKYKFPG